MFEKIKKVHILAVGGIGMSAICLLLLKKGIKVSGSDKFKSSLILELIEKGLEFLKETDSLDNEVELVVFSSAISNDHPQRIQALNTNILTIHRSKALTELMKCKKTLLVAGTHGKTTTSSLLVHCLKHLNQKPSYAIGGLFSSGGQHADFDEGEYFIAEADESDGSFLSYDPTGIIVTNIDQDHMDYWENMERLKRGFYQFMSLCSDRKLCIFYKDDPVLGKLNFPGTTYGQSLNSDFKLLYDKSSSVGRDFLFLSEKGNLVKGSLLLNGQHNVLNALSVFSLLSCLGFEEKGIIEALGAFKGVDRRCQIKGTVGDTLWIDDYGHHPSEIKTTLQGIKDRYPGKSLTVIFQPHRFSRTKDLWDAFHHSFFHEDELIITDIYGAHEVNHHNIHSSDLAVKLSSKLLKPVSYSPRNALKELIITTDIAVTFGAGDITDLFNEVKKG